ncbi:MAG: B12-binding domain-containing protein, partial [Dehalococcoidales bacterium]
MSDESMFEKLNNALIAGDKSGLEQGVGDALKEGVTPSDIIEKGMSPGMKEVGERFARYEIYLPEMMMAAEAWEGAMQILEPKLLESGSELKKAGRVVIGTVKG